MLQYGKKDLCDHLTIVGIVLLFFSLLFHVMIGINSIFEIVLTHPKSSQFLYIVLDLLSSILYALTFVLPVFFYKRLSKNKNYPSMQLSFRFSENRPFLSSLAIVFIGISFCLACSVINSVLFPLVYSAAEAESSFSHEYQWILLLISGAIAPAFSEELFFRGIILSSIKPYSKSGAILISALVFGFMHQTPYQIFYATAMGIILGVVYVKTGTIWSCVLLHFTNNFFSVIQSVLLYLFDRTLGQIVYYVTLGVIISLGFLLGAILYSIAHKKTKDIEGTGVFGEYRTFDNRLMQCEPSFVLRQALATPPIVAFMIICAVNIILQALNI